MARMDNVCTIEGNLGHDPELRFTQSGTAVANLSVAIAERRKVDGEWEDDEPTWWSVTVWDRLAENVADSLSKGDRVRCTGRSKTERWESREGDPRSKLTMVADDIAVPLRWCTVEIARNEKRNGGPPPPSDDDRPAHDYDEEPF